MIWPFRRKKPVVDIREGGWQWAPGVLAECLVDAFVLFPFDPRKGQILRVSAVHDDVGDRGIRAYFLFFEGLPLVGYSSNAFRPVRPVNSGEEIETGLIAKIKRSAKRGAPVGEPVA